MRPAPPSYTLLLCLLLLASSLASVGCSSRRPLAWNTYGSIGWGSADAEQAVPGINQAMVKWYMRDKQLIYVVWTDLSGGGDTRASLGSSSSKLKIHHQAHLESSDGASFEFEYTLDTNNNDSSNAGAVKIDGIDYELKNGALVLVSTQRNKVKAKQLDLDPTVIDCIRNKSQSAESLRKAMKALANEHSEIREFFQSAENDE
jgi:hypothetical protein